MGSTGNLLYLLLLYAVLDKDGKLGTSTGLLLAVGIMVATNLGNNCCNRCCCSSNNGNFVGGNFNNFLASNALI